MQPSMRPTEGNAFLASLSDVDQQHLAPHLRDVPLRLHTVLIKPNENIEFVYFPSEGMVSVVTELQNGQIVETGIHGREGVVGSSVIASPHAFEHSIVQVEGAGRRLPAKVFIEAYKRSPAFQDLVNKHHLLLWVHAQQTAACNASHTVRQRLARWLLTTRDWISSDELPLTQEYMSQMLGVQRTTVTLEMSNFKKAGLVESRRGRTMLIDIEGLQARACECCSVIKARRDELSPKGRDARQSN
ncbi:MAG: hypothetical protein QOD74_998 [Variibacter sp.]|nr:hypothetical protein [Variibacter sp.]